MIKINLIPPEYIDSINRRILVAKIILGAVAFIACVAFVSVYHVTKAKNLDTLLVQRQKELKILQKDLQKVNIIEAQISEVQKYLNAIDQITKTRFVYTRFMQDLLVDLPETIWFTRIGTTLKGDVLNLDFALKSRSAYDLAYWVNLLETDDKYSKVEMGTFLIKKSEEGDVFSAPIKTKYTLSGL
ncbi:MAG: hypothetical protein KAQ76_00035 [Elusimicrobiales bacterium]|nr:hypothetical protein [Elusimicrobiales bacterium]